ncbi:single Ig IL-1-related receptor-like [Saccoglossus kowalevskii]
MDVFVARDGMEHTAQKVSLDVGAPEFVFCPHNITALLDEGSSSTAVTWPKVEVNDNSGLLNLTSNHQAGDTFIIGIHNILYTAVDNHGNTAICRFSVNLRAANIGTTVKTVFIVTSLVPVVLFSFGAVVCLRYRKNKLMYPALFGRSEDDDDKEWDAFVAVRGGTEDETFVYKELLHELEENNDYKVNIHHRDFIPGIQFVRSEWCNYEVDQAKFEMFGLRHKLIPIMFEDVTYMGDEMSATLKSILDSINYLTWPRNGSEKEQKEFWKKLISAMPRKHKEQDLQQRHGFISGIVNRICHRKLYLRLPNDNECEEIDLENI